jgi:hypothetical protein
VDGNGNQILPPGSIDSSIFKIFDGSGTGFLQYSDLKAVPNSNLCPGPGCYGDEPGLETLRKALENRAFGKGIIRDDSLLVVLVVGNGDDNSNVNMCRRPIDGVTVPCEQVNGVCQDTSGNAITKDNLFDKNLSGQYLYLGKTCGTRDASFAYYLSHLQSLRGSSQLVQFHAAVAASQSTGCLGSGSYIGTRYRAMADATGGAKFDICSQSVSGVLDSLNANLQAQKLGYRTRYLFVDQPPDLSTVQVTRYRGGTAAGAVDVPQDSSDGWTYAGYVTNVYAIDSPIPMNLSSGYALELHGSARLIGNDTADVTFRPAGAHDSQTP